MASLGRLNDDQRALLAGLDPETRMAVKAAFIDWVTIARSEGYQPMSMWQAFLVEVDHSALLQRLLEGGEPFRERPPVTNGYPDYRAAATRQETLANGDQWTLEQHRRVGDAKVRTVLRLGSVEVELTPEQALAIDGVTR